MGSPPRMREILDADIEKAIGLGITPAYAGNTQYGHVARHQVWDHPRLCGKYLMARRRCLRWLGSPPPMREIRGVRRWCVLGLGITPAYAGNTRTPSTISAANWDHPRLCGKYAACAVGASWVLGSPPPMREIL